MVVLDQEILVQREQYIKKLKSWLGQNDLVKIVTGVRRCGKSKLFVLFQNELIKEKITTKSCIININLEDVLQVRKIGLSYNSEGIIEDYNKLLDYIVAKLKSNKLNFVFIDEVQLLENWWLLANTLRLQNNVDVYLTGSNAHMFSSDLANVFGGRYIEIRMQPFSFREYCEASLEIKKQGNTKTKKKTLVHDLQTLYSKYIKESGFPQTIKLDSEDLIYDYLINTVYLNTIQKDIISRFGITDVDKLNSVIKYIFDNIGNETSLRGIAKGLNNSGQNISIPTLTTYIQGLIESYFIYKCDRYDIKGKKYLGSSSKFYVADIGLRNAVLKRSSDKDLGHILENIVYLELLRRGYNVSVGKITKSVRNKEKRENKTIEVDFIARKRDQLEYYQVALNVMEPSVLERELSPLEEIRDNYPKFLLTMDYGSGDNNGIKRLNVLDWLFNNDI